MIKRWVVCISVLLVSLFFAFAAVAQTDAESPKDKEVAGYLQQGLSVFLCFYSATEPNLNRIKGEVNAVATNFKGSTEAVYVSGADKKEDALRGKFKMQPNETAVFIIQPSGNAVAKLTGADITKSNLMKALVSSCGGGECGSGGCG